jgi:hypothetical protein
MNEQFKYDVFISHSAQDKPAVRELAERLRRDCPARVIRL